MRWFVGLVMTGALGVAACSGAPAAVSPATAADPVEVVASTTSLATTTTAMPFEVAVSTTVDVPVDRADPQRLISTGLGVDVVVSTESKTSGLIDPKPGEVIWVPVGDRDAGPGEAGLVLIAGHLNIGEPFYNLIDDSRLDRRNGVDDHGLPVGATIDFELADTTSCRYRVIEPLGTDLPNVERVPGQPAIYFPKQSDVMNPILAQLITDVDDRAIAMMWVSYAGPNNDQWRPNGTNRANNAVVFTQLETCTNPTSE